MCRSVIEKSPISSMRLGIDAYRKAQGNPHADLRAPYALRRTEKSDISHEEEQVVGASARALKSEVLRSLHPQSNSGMVSMRDVATALDHILKR